MDRGNLVALRGFAVAFHATIADGLPDQTHGHGASVAFAGQLTGTRWRHPRRNDPGSKRRGDPRAIEKCTRGQADRPNPLFVWRAGQDLNPQPPRFVA